MTLMCNNAFEVTVELNFEIRRAEARHDQDVWEDCEDSKLHDLLLTAGQGFVPASSVVYAMVEGECVGAIQHTDYDSMDFMLCSIHTVYVKEEFRRKGIAEAMLKTLICDPAYDSFMLDAEYGNPASFALYTKLGFIPHTINMQRRRA